MKKETVEENKQNRKTRKPGRETAPIVKLDKADSHTETTGRQMSLLYVLQFSIGVLSPRFKLRLAMNGCEGCAHILVDVAIR